MFMEFLVEYYQISFLALAQTTRLLTTGAEIPIRDESGRQDIRVSLMVVVLSVGENDFTVASISLDEFQSG